MQLYNTHKIEELLGLWHNSHQILYTNIEGTGRHKSVPAILTETVAKTGDRVAHR